jgi:hypothetical protein
MENIMKKKIIAGIVTIMTTLGIQTSEANAGIFIQAGPIFTPSTVVQSPQVMQVPQVVQTTTEYVGQQSYCREFTQTFTIAEQTQRGYGTACLQPDGSWQIQSSQTANSLNTQQPQAIQYVVRDQSVYVVPPRPWIVAHFPVIPYVVNYHPHHIEGRHYERRQYR